MKQTRLEDFRIREFKKLLNIAKGYNTQNQFLDRCGVDPQYIKRILDNQNFIIPSDNILRSIEWGSNGAVSFAELKEVFKGLTQPEIRRGDIWYVDLGKEYGSVQGNERPCVIIGNDIGNDRSPVVIVAPLTSRIKRVMPTHVSLPVDRITGLTKESYAMCEQIKTVDKQKVMSYLGNVNDETMNKIERAERISLGMCTEYDKMKDLAKKNTVFGAMFSKLLSEFEKFTETEEVAV